jgi:hypothetical protein
VFERLVPEGVGAGMVFHANGEESFVEPGVPAPGHVTLSRRRVCPSDRPVAPGPAGSPSPRLSEMVVYPGAVHDGYRDGWEWYRVTCADLGVMVDWYRAAMERGEWRLAATEGPMDPFRRRLLFVRPTEIGVPPEQRTAVAEVDLAREWPYQFRLALRRDPGGVLPLPLAP